MHIVGGIVKGAFDDSIATSGISPTCRKCCDACCEELYVIHFWWTICRKGEPRRRHLGRKVVKIDEERAIHTRSKALVWYPAGPVDGRAGTIEVVVNRRQHK